MFQHHNPQLFSPAVLDLSNIRKVNGLSLDDITRMCSLAKTKGDGVKRDKVVLGQQALTDSYTASICWWKYKHANQGVT